MDRPIFYTGIHHPAMAWGLERVMVSLNVLEHRRRDFEQECARAGRWILDSGAFTRTGRGAGHLPVAEYANHIRRWAGCGDLEAAVCQDYMCEPLILEITGLSVAEHQRLTTRNYLALRDLAPDTHIMPVLQGWDPEDYARHTRAMSPHLEEDAWTGGRLSVPAAGAPGRHIGGPDGHPAGETGPAPARVRGEEDSAPARRHIGAAAQRGLDGLVLRREISGPPAEQLPPVRSGVDPGGGELPGAAVPAGNAVTFAKCSKRHGWRRERRQGLFPTKKLLTAHPSAHANQGRESKPAAQCEENG